MRLAWILILLTGCATMTEEIKDFEIATLAGGCFWCMEAAFEEMEGVIEVVSGYTGGHVENPTYKQVTSGNTGHLEAVQIKYNSSKISYKELIDFYWRQIDPTDDAGQFVDKGSFYRTAIFYHNETQKKIAEESKAQLEKSGMFDKPIVTQILEFDKFYKAEEYHQDYYKKRTIQYRLYESGSGRKEFKEEVWG